MKRIKIAVAILAVALAASGCSQNPYIRNAETRGAMWGVAGTAVIAGLLYSIFSYRQQASGAQYAPAAIPVGARVVDCPYGVRAPCWILPDQGQAVPTSNAQVVGKITRETGRKAVVLRNGCGKGFKLPDPLPIPAAGKQVVVKCVPDR